MCEAESKVHHREPLFSYGVQDNYIITEDIVFEQYEEEIDLEEPHLMEVPDELQNIDLIIEENIEEYPILANPGWEVAIEELGCDIVAEEEETLLATQDVQPVPLIEEDVGP
jgi:hypothetical protein